ncbi:MAG: winged helix-turn-helix transcriptional regulator [Hamadaea sp.]|nr:winged helix-turn-helix transcriptional regulator [Hamadaea sp.]NUR51809.1 winged helix-turn-helix transcriptional regulator [Hamadaea sp.]NUT07268.1 winged helix-turn-helix transcriptional regulator [Hamadaea sp.]
MSGGQLTFDDELAAALADPGLPVEDDTLAFRSVLRTPSRVVDDLLAEPDRVHAQLAADVAERARTAARHGVEAMLAGLAPGLVRWSHPFLEYAGPPAPDHRLAGRGLVLVPSMFLTDAVHRQLNDRQQPMLFYPARTALGFWRDDRAADGRLAGPVGESRARILRLLAVRPLGTSELAAELGVAPSTASEQLTALRQAGLVATTRSGRQACHEPTALAWSLLDVYIG